MELFTEEDTNGADKSPVLLRRPTPEPISFSLPQADFDDDIEDEDLNTDRYSLYLCLVYSVASHHDVCPADRCYSFSRN